MCHVSIKNASKEYEFVFGMQMSHYTCRTNGKELNKILENLVQLNFNTSPVSFKIIIFILVYTKLSFE